MPRQSGNLPGTLVRFPAQAVQENPAEACHILPGISAGVIPDPGEPGAAPGVQHNGLPVQPPVGEALPVEQVQGLHKPVQNAQGLLGQQEAAPHFHIFFQAAAPDLLTDPVAGSVLLKGHFDSGDLRQPAVPTQGLGNPAEPGRAPGEGRAGRLYLRTLPPGGVLGVEFQQPHRLPQGLIQRQVGDGLGELLQNLAHQEPSGQHRPPGKLMGQVLLLLPGAAALAHRLVGQVHAPVAPSLCH